MRWIQRLVIAMAVAVVLTSCGTGGDVQAGEDAEPTTTGSAADAEATSGSVAEAPDNDFVVPLCTTIVEVSPPDEAFGDTPIYVANEMPTEAVQAWASTKPGYEGLWIDRDHNGWIVVAFSEGAQERQQELAAEFPDDGVVTVAVAWTDAELAALQQRVTDTLRSEVESFSSGYRLSSGVVSIGFGVLTAARHQVVDDLFAGEAVCVEGGDPADQPAPGSQPEGGEHWRLLADAPGVGVPYRTGFAADAESFAELWTSIGLTDPVPTVAFDDEVVIWFGPSVSGSCSDIRLDEVVVAEETIHAVIVLIDPPAMCTSDANAHAYLVALDRDVLPPSGFQIQVDADGPPSGAPEEITVVDGDLAVVDAEPGPPAPGPPTPGFIEPGFAFPYDYYLHCGVEWLPDRINDIAWRSESGDTPDAWRADAVDETIRVELLLTVDPEPILEVSAAGVTVTYRPTNEDPPGCD